MSMNNTQPKQATAAAVSSENRRARMVAAALDRDRALDPELFTALQSRLDPPVVTRRRVLWALLLPLSAAVLVALRSLLAARTPLRLDLTDLPARAWLGYGLQFACVAVAMFAVAHRNRHGFAWPAVALQGLAWLLVGLAGLTPLLTRGLEPQPILHALGAPCAVVIATSGMCALLVAAVLYRRAQPIAAGAHAALLGAATAAWAGLVISLHCPGETLAHVVWGHSLPMALMLPLAVLTLPRFLRP